MRGLMVPEIRSIAQPASILVPRVPFQVGHKVGISYQGEEDKFQLIKKIQGASSFNQFQIRTHDTKKTADKDVKNKNPPRRSGTPPKEGIFPCGSVFRCLV